MKNRSRKVHLCPISFSKGENRKGRKQNNKRYNKGIPMILKKELKWYLTSWLWGRMPANNILEILKENDLGTIHRPNFDSSVRKKVDFSAHISLGVSVPALLSCDWESKRRRGRDELQVLWDFPGSLVVETPLFQCRESRFNIWLGN